MINKIPITVSISHETIKKFDFICKMSDMTRSKYIEIILSDVIEEFEKSQKEVQENETENRTEPDNRRMESRESER